MTQHKRPQWLAAPATPKPVKLLPISPRPPAWNLLREVRSIKISELASELPVSDEQVGRLMNELQDLLAHARSGGLSDEVILWVLEDAVASLNKKL